MQRNILILIVAVSVAFGASAVAATNTANVEVDQGPDGTATVAVTNADEEPVENASLTVEVADEDQPDYDGVGNYTTDANGTVELTAPEETVDVLVTATVENETVSTEARLEAAPELSVDIHQETGHPVAVTVTADDEPVENATLDVETVDENATYEGTGEHTTDENGTVELPTPTETVEVIASTEYRGASASASGFLEAPPELDVSVTQDRGHAATVTVTADGEVAENATVSIDVLDENTTYAGANETYETDESGTVELPAPEESVDVTVLVELDGASASTKTELEAAPELGIGVDQDGPGLPATVTVLADDEPAENATVDVDLVDPENTSYTGTGAYETGENGTVELPAPEETVNVTVRATYQGAEETSTVALEGIDGIDADLPFGQQLQQFVTALGVDIQNGREIASWVTENNPGNAPDHAGPKETTERENAASGLLDAERNGENRDSGSGNDGGDAAGKRSDDAGANGNAKAGEGNR